MVTAIRALLPPTVSFITGQVIDVETGPARQLVRLFSGEALGCRLVVLATGEGNGLLRKLGIGRRTIRDDHSLAIGLDIMAGSGNPVETSVLVHYGENLSDRMDYVSLFPLGTALRANLFCYRHISEPWTRHFRCQPREALLGVMPGLRRLIGDFRVSGKAQIRTNHLRQADGYLRDGIVLVGDAFQTSCPAAGTGIGRLLTDVDRLCNEHLPRWLTAGAASSEQIAQFYNDPVKRACDVEAIRIAEYRRSISVDTSLSWRLHRAAIFACRTIRGRIPRRGRNASAADAPAAPVLDSMPVSA